MMFGRCFGRNLVKFQEYKIPSLSSDVGFWEWVLFGFFFHVFNNKGYKIPAKHIDLVRVIKIFAFNTLLVRKVRSIKSCQV